mmetsp:Transcript_89607/g.231273  ORF Transcript_89607/g.231273 Transcript_89607/m.231273 type:complete len:325 (+) Transcript_89607:279-1253(+)
MRASVVAVAHLQADCVLDSRPPEERRSEPALRPTWICTRRRLASKGISGTSITGRSWSFAPEARRAARCVDEVLREDEWKRDVEYLEEPTKRAVPTRPGNVHGVDSSSSCSSAFWCAVSACGARVTGASKMPASDTGWDTGAASKSISDGTAGACTDTAAATGAGAPAISAHSRGTSGNAAALQLTRMPRRSTLLPELRRATREPEAQRRATQPRHHTAADWLLLFCTAARGAAPTALGEYLMPGPTGLVPAGGCRAVTKAVPAWTSATHATAATSAAGRRRGGALPFTIVGAANRPMHSGRARPPCLPASPRRASPFTAKLEP